MKKIQIQGKIHKRFGFVLWMSLCVVLFGWDMEEKNGKE